ncbi:hypothetical protein [Argonema antarcticum]|uniref:hypothetical protein n=1 Tax=Argonema antarcticum TaxID=2942763 RepID=UPI002010F88A|nr:hypothetical protein [Argonema antarcticum]MCL1471621.1 hypothetical protein [Argonema antarcticum A004/B2]
MQVKDMTVEQLTDLIRHTVEQCLDEYFGDPDEGKEIKEEVKQQLIEQMQRRKSGERGIPAEEVYQKLGLQRE